MKIVFLNGSARAQGNTGELLKRIVRELDPLLFKVEILNLGDLRIQYCRGCHVCEETRNCVQNDHVERIYQSFRSADLIVIASPSYWGDITGQLKVFIDRSTPYCNTIDGKTTFPGGKKAMALAIRAGSSPGESEDVLASINHYFSHLEMESCFQRSFESIGSAADFDHRKNREGIFSIVEKIKALG